MFFKGKWIENSRDVKKLLKKEKKFKAPIIKNRRKVEVKKKIEEIKQQTSSKMEIVYVFDKNYLKYFNVSVKSVLKYNPYTHITVISPEKLDIPYDNVVMDIPPNVKHRENDRITSATFLKLQIPKLPYDKVLFIDADIICQAPLDELWNMECNYICLTEFNKSKLIRTEMHDGSEFYNGSLFGMELYSNDDCLVFYTST